jgi:hypothetical protein
MIYHPNNFFLKSPWEILGVDLPNQQFPQIRFSAKLIDQRDHVFRGAKAVKSGSRRDYIHPTRDAGEACAESLSDLRW